MEKAESGDPERVLVTRIAAGESRINSVPTTLPVTEPGSERETTPDRGVATVGGHKIDADLAGGSDDTGGSQAQQLPAGAVGEPILPPAVSKRSLL